MLSGFFCLLLTYFDKNEKLFTFEKNKYNALHSLRILIKNQKSPNQKLFMNSIEKELIQILKTIEGNGAFETSGVSDLVLPGLRIEGVGELGLPISPSQVKDLIKAAHKAPFGKGSKTITDTKVRSAWEIDANQLSFHNPDWKKFMAKVTKKVQKGLGIKDKTVDISLYKLLIYEEGDFFLPHKDSEKEPGMFATLVVALPSEHTGGELVIRFGGSEETVDFSQPASNYKMSFAAFYADCEHEIKPVTSGYRVCLVYNLLQTADDSITSPVFGGQAAEMSLLLKSWIGKSKDLPKAVLLGHEYTPANFSLTNLKLHDRPRAEALVAAADSAGFFARLALVTEYQMGQLEDYDDYDSYYSRRRRGRYYDDDSGDPTDGSMGEIYEQYTRIEGWADEEGNPGLGDINIDHDDILTDAELGTGEPTEKVYSWIGSNFMRTIGRTRRSTQRTMPHKSSKVLAIFPKMTANMAIATVIIIKITPDLRLLWCR